MEEIKGWKQSEIEMMLSLSEGTTILNEEEVVAIENDLKQVEPFQDAIKEIQTDIYDIINYKMEVENGKKTNSRNRQ